MENKNNLENMTDEQIDQIIDFLVSEGYIDKKARVEAKIQIIYKAIKKWGGVNPYVSQDVRECILSIADIFTENYEKKGNKDCKRKTPPEDAIKRKMYVDIIDGIVGVLFKYYGRTGFCERVDPQRVQVID